MAIIDLIQARTGFPCRPGHFFQGLEVIMGNEDLSSIIYRYIEGFITAVERLEMAKEELKAFQKQPKPEKPAVIKSQKEFIQYLDFVSAYDARQAAAEDAVMEAADRRRSQEKALICYLPFGIWIEHERYAIGIGRDDEGQKKVFMVKRNPESNYPFSKSLKEIDD
jgi:hypothetical protein